MVDSEHAFDPKHCLLTSVWNKTVLVLCTWLEEASNRIVHNHIVNRRTGGLCTHDWQKVIPLLYARFTSIVLLQAMQSPIFEGLGTLYLHVSS